MCVPPTSPVAQICTTASGGRGCVCVLLPCAHSFLSLQTTSTLTVTPVPAAPHPTPYRCRFNQNGSKLQHRTIGWVVFTFTDAFWCAIGYVYTAYCRVHALVTSQKSVAKRNQACHCTSIWWYSKSMNYLPFNLPINDALPLHQHPNRYLDHLE